jgi:hypothetical protein
MVVFGVKLVVQLVAQGVVGLFAADLAVVIGAILLVVVVGLVVVMGSAIRACLQCGWSKTAPDAQSESTPAKSGSWGRSCLLASCMATDIGVQ